MKSHITKYQISNQIVSNDFKEASNLSSRLFKYEASYILVISIIKLKNKELSIRELDIKIAFAGKDRYPKLAVAKAQPSIALLVNCCKLWWGMSLCLCLDRHSRLCFPNKAIEKSSCYISNDFELLKKPKFTTYVREIFRYAIL